MEQRLTDLNDRIEALRMELLAQLQLLGWAMGGGRRQETGGRSQETGDRSHEQALL
jgi:hypothetical protein